MPESITFVDSSEVVEGKLEEVKTVLKELVDFVEANEPRAIAYNVFFNEDGTLMTFVQMHLDSASMEFHMKAAADLFRKFAGLITMQTMDIYGSPSAELLELMQSKATMLGARHVAVHNLYAGFTRLAAG